MEATVSFGEWVRLRREVLGLSRPELAARVGCAVVTIRKIEGDERRPSAQVAALLAQQLELSVADRPAFVRAARAQLAPDRLPPPGGAAALAPVLPLPRNPLIGREPELATLADLLRSDATALLTLLGPPGVGKTSLALLAAQSAAPDFPDGVFFVPLAALRDPAQVALAIAQALCVQTTSNQAVQAALLAWLRNKHVLLLLDNFEHLLAAAPQVAALLAAAPGLKVLATSRAALRLSAEREFAVPPLALPLGGDTPPAALLRSPAVQLFAQRARAVRPDFALAEDDVPTIAAICRQLDGLPLAIELAAARSKLFGPAALLARLANRLQVLTGGMRDLPERHQTLQSAIAWSYDLLEPAEQALFRQLGVVVGECALPAVAALAGTAEPPLALLESLIDKCLLTQHAGADGEPRFSMLETVREYALEQLAAQADAEAVRLRHAQFYLALAETADAGLQGADQIAWLARLDAEHGNLRAVLAWCLDDATPDQPAPRALRVEIAQRIGGALWLFWQIRSFYREAHSWLARALAPENPPTPDAARARAMNGLGFILYCEHELEQAAACLHEALVLARAAAEQPLAAHILNNLATLAVDQREFARVEEFASASFEMAREQGLTWLCGWSQLTCGRAAFERQNWDESKQLFERAYAYFRSIGALRGEAFSLMFQAETALRQGDLARAEPQYKKALLMVRALNDIHGIIYSLADCGRIAALRGDYDAARSMLTESLQLAREQSDTQGVCWALVGLAYVLASLGDTAGAQAHALEAISLAQTVDDPVSVFAAMATIAYANASAGRVEIAAHLIGSAEALRDRLRLQLFSIDKAGCAQVYAAVRALLAPPALEAALARGRELSFVEALDLLA